MLRNFNVALVTPSPPADCVATPSTLVGEGGDEGQVRTVPSERSPSPRPSPIEGEGKDDKFEIRFLTFDTALLAARRFISNNKETFMKKRRVVITGLGVVSANGIGVKKFWKSVTAGKSGVSRISSFNTRKYSVNIAAEIKKFKPEKYLKEDEIKLNARSGQFALIAAKEAMEDSGLMKYGYDNERIGVSIGTAGGGMDYVLEQHKIFLNKSPFQMDTFVTSIAIQSSAVRAISIAYRAKAFCQTFSSACAASADAIGCGLNTIRAGKADIMIAGGAETPLHPMIFTGFCLGRVLTNCGNKNIDAPKPFDANRCGTVLGEGAAMLVLEDYEHAKKRGAHIYAELAGYASTCDGYHIVIPDPEGKQGSRAVKSALKDAGISRGKVDYINAHGTGTVRNDAMETTVIKNVFGKRAYNIPVSSTKSITGHLLGASGAIEAVICALALKHGIIPPTINLKTPDKNCDLDYVPNKARKKNIKVAVSNSFGLGGFNSVLVFVK